MTEFKAMDVIFWVLLFILSTAAILYLLLSVQEGFHLPVEIFRSRG